MTDPIQSLYPDVRVRLIRVYAAMLAHHKLTMRCTQGVRTYEEQDELYAQGRTQAGSIVTWARRGESFHNYGCAADSCFIGADPYLDKLPRGFLMWNEYGRFGEAYGLKWGGTWTSHADKPHLELTYGLSLHEMKQLYGVGGIQSVWAQFDKIRGVEIGEGWKVPVLSVGK